MLQITSVCIFVSLSYQSKKHTILKMHRNVVSHQDPLLRPTLALLWERGSPPSCAHEKIWRPWCLGR